MPSSSRMQISGNGAPLAGCCCCLFQQSTTRAVPSALRGWQKIHLPCSIRWTPPELAPSFTCRGDALPRSPASLAAASFALRAWADCCRASVRDSTPCPDAGSAARGLWGVPRLASFRRCPAAFLVAKRSAYPRGILLVGDGSGADDGPTLGPGESGPGEGVPNLGPGEVGPGEMAPGSVGWRRIGTELTRRGPALPLR